jgi:hypothetical protein
MNASHILNKIISLVSFNIHKARQSTLLFCVQSLPDGYCATVTSIGRGISGDAFEKHRIKRADRFLSNKHLQREIPGMYAVICKLFCTSNRPVIAVDWSDMDDNKTHFLIRAAILLKGRPITLYQEIHTKRTKEKPKTHQDFLKTLHALLHRDCKPIIVTDAGFKSPWFRPVLALGWDIVGRVRKPHHFSLNESENWRCITELYKKATTRPGLFLSARIAKANPFECTLVLVKQLSKGRQAKNADGSQKCSKKSKKYAQGAQDPWLLATSLPVRGDLAKKVVDIYKQRMQIEEGFRDMKSQRFGLGFEYNKTIKLERMNVLIFLTTLASIVAIVTGLTLVESGKHRQFQANTAKRKVLSFHSLGLRAWRRVTGFCEEHLRAALATLKKMMIAAAQEV